MRLQFLWKRTYLNLIKYFLCLFLLVSCGGGDTPTPRQSNGAQLSLKGEIRLAPGALATVFWDVNGNWEVDPWEVAVTASASGQYEIAPRPRAEAVLRAETRWLTPDAFGSYLGPVPLSSLNGQESIISPLTSLAQISDMSVLQVESELGIPASSGDSANELLNDVASAIAIQLRQRKGQLEVGEGTIAARSIMNQTKQLIGETNIQFAIEEVKKSQSIQNQAIKSNTIAARAQNLPTFTKATYFSNKVSGFENYLWSTENQNQRDAVEKILFEMKFLSKSIEGRNDGIIRFNSFQIGQMKKWETLLTAAGLVRNGQEILWDTEQNKQKQQIDKTFVNQAENANRAAWLSESGQTLANRDLYFNTIDAVLGLVAVGYGIPVNKAFNADETIHPQTVQRILNIAKVLNCNTGVFLLSTDVTTWKSEKFFQMTNRLTECFVDRNSRVNLSGILKLFADLDPVSDVGKALLDGINQPDPVKKNIVALRLIATTLSLAADRITNARGSGAFELVSAAIRIYADSLEILDQNQGLYDQKISAVETAWKQAYSEVERKHWARKLEYRINQVITYSPRPLPAGASLSCTPKPPLKASCTLGYLPALNLKTRPLITKPSLVQMSAANDTIAGILVSFGDGWTTRNLPEFAGKNILLGATLEHSYLTPGTYTVVATTTFANGESFRDESVVSVVNDAPAANGSCGSANGVAVTQSPSANLCSASSANSVTGNGPWSWSCAGTNGGTNASCSAPLIPPIDPVNGICGSANAVAVLQRPISNLCSAGSASVATGVGPWSWSCSGSSGGSTAICTAPLANRVIQPIVSDFTPKLGSRGNTVTVIVTGSNLPDSLALAIANVSCTNSGVLSSSTSQIFDCAIPSSAPLGMALVTVKDRAGGIVLFQPSLAQGFEIMR